ncbi:tRNA (cytidine(56)-2'-O)-methyltransferase [Methanothermobacter sp.]|uniref:tRNA (cytidine(56)-2'-O)-methyltransferase n=1 Tax=Methanothermobacter sp. TaxID=1884223 RepID=UPI00260B002C|nr:tRNA (cytidine(56)-2'-O)-methyltransferase [Methanothermobacter sp.]MDI9614957.1 tRNA (cytidine(56)-2'-O)-methyltransferase [Methanothermobacter sp.]
MMDIRVLRLGHRKSRDARITTHVCLTARAFGASEVILSGEEDPKLMEGVDDVVKRWGGPFRVSYRRNWQGVIESWKQMGGEVVHLTMYGLPARDVIPDLRESPAGKLVVVGGARVPGKVYRLADYNVGVTNQPHSEVSSLAVFLHMLLDGGEFDLKFENPMIEVVPQAHGKKLIERGGDVDAQGDR